MIVRNPPIDGRGENIEPTESPNINDDARLEVGEVRMFAGQTHMRPTGAFNVGVRETPIEFRRWSGHEWEPVENPKLPRS